VVVGGERNFFLEIKKLIYFIYFLFLIVFSSSCLPFSWFHLLSLSIFGSVDSIAPCSPSSVTVTQKKNIPPKKSPGRKQNTVIVLVNTSRSLKGGPEPFVKKNNEILGSKREDQFSDLVFEVVQNTTLVRFSYLLRLRNLREMPKFPHKCQKIAGC